MNFVSVLKKIGRVAVGVEKIALPLAATLLPQYAPALNKIDGWVNRFTAMVVAAEDSIPQDGSGALKSSAVIADFETGLDFTNSILATRGKMLEYDKAELQGAINDFASGYNRLAKVKQSFKEVDLPK